MFGGTTNYLSVIDQNFSDYSVQPNSMFQQQGSSFQHSTYLNLVQQQTQNLSRTPVLLTPSPVVTPSVMSERTIELEALVIKGVQNWTVI